MKNVNPFSLMQDKWKKIKGISLIPAKDAKKDINFLLREIDRVSTINVTLETKIDQLEYEIEHTQGLLQAEYEEQAGASL